MFTIINSQLEPVYRIANSFLWNIFSLMKMVSTFFFLISYFVYILVMIIYSFVIFYFNV